MAGIVLLMPIFVSHFDLVGASLTFLFIRIMVWISLYFLFKKNVKKSLRIIIAPLSELSNVIEKIVTDNETKFVKYLNNAQPLTPRIHALELIPGIGKTYMKTMLEEREKQQFESYLDLQDRVGFKDPVKHISERIMDEISGQSRMNLFVKR